MSNRFVPKLKDRDLVRAFELVRGQTSYPDRVIEYTDQFHQSIDQKDIDEIVKLQGYEIRSAKIHSHNVAWLLRRLEDQKHLSLDIVELHFNDRPVQNGGRPQVIGDFYKITALLTDALSRPLASVPQSEDLVVLRSHSHVLESMESVAANLITETDRHRRDLDLQYLNREESRQKYFDDLVASERAGLTQERIRQEELFTKRSDVLDKKTEDLELLQQQLDDRNNTHVRREIRSSLLKLAKDRLENFSVSGATKRQYLTVNAASIAGFAILAVGSIYFGSQVTVDPQTKTYPAEELALIVKSMSLAVTAIALGSWYLGWLNRWLQRIADAEFKLQQFSLDIERASWLAETVLEWKSNSQEPFPELLASRLSSGLFQSSGTEADGPRTPAAHLAEALLGSASSAKLKFGDNELNLDRKGIGKLDE